LEKNISPSDFVLESCSSSIPNLHKRNLQHSPGKLKKLLRSVAQTEAAGFIVLKAATAVKARAA